MRRFSMIRLFCLALAATLSSSLAGSSFAEGPLDIKPFVKMPSRRRSRPSSPAFTCRALSCQFEVETFFATETNPKTYA